MPTKGTSTLGLYRFLLQQGQEEILKKALYLLIKDQKWMTQTFVKNFLQVIAVEKIGTVYTRCLKRKSSALLQIGRQQSTLVKTPPRC